MSSRVVKFATLLMFLGLAACDFPHGGDGKYWISPKDAPEVRERLLKSVNGVRASRGSRPLVYNEHLNAAAESHARDMALQERLWNFGSDASSPLERAARAGYQGLVLGENLSESFESEIATLAAWMEAPRPSAIVVSAGADEMGLGWFQEEDGKLWWTMLVGTQSVSPPNIVPITPVDTTVDILNGEVLTPDTVINSLDALVEDL